MSMPDGRYVKVREMYSDWGLGPIFHHPVPIIVPMLVVCGVMFQIAFDRVATKTAAAVILLPIPATFRFN